MQSCDAALWQRVYKPKRLTVLKDCITVTGRVEQIARDADGDAHMLLRLDKGQESLVNARNRKKKNGDLVVEVVCAFAPSSPKSAVRTCAGYTSPLTLPKVGDRIRATGSYVLDTHNGWNEVHPATSINVVSGAG